MGIWLESNLFYAVKLELSWKFYSFPVTKILITADIIYMSAPLCNLLFLHSFLKNVGHFNLGFKKS